MESVFPLHGEHAVLVWNHIPILLSYKYDLSCMIEDLLLIIEELQSRHSGELTNHWVSNTFAHEWRFEWSDNRLTIESKWGEIGNGLDELLRRSGPVTLDIEAFMGEWKRVLENVIEALRQAGHEEAESEEMTRLVKVWSSIEAEGILYPSNE
ncbi:hypothetical protein [Saccharibacillus endophyticus]|uniref:Uncharacterized protein n=1 Tax=Saccharibacillus endophyticus TaxID=2060666 RepID=A0ABQ2A283_9BACL|nr:hypothetical protein [Saccharibacillus endophyticus]GGH82568.1 hypothetical protein GCM10007362_34080 [Saccharibacillus endophyticus]